MIQFTDNKRKCSGCGTNARIVLDDNGNTMCCLACEREQVRWTREDDTWCDDPCFKQWDRAVSKAWARRQG